MKKSNFPSLPRRMKATVDAPVMGKVTSAAVSETEHLYLCTRAHKHSTHLRRSGSGAQSRAIDEIKVHLWLVRVKDGAMFVRPHRAAGGDIYFLVGCSFL